MLTLILSTLLITSSLCGIEIIHDGPEFDHYAYSGNCSAATNGERAVIRKYIQNNMTVFDVGASSGSWSTATLREHPSVQIYAFEPIPEKFELLKNNLTDTIIASCCAVSNKNSSYGRLIYYPDYPNHSTFYGRSTKIHQHTHKQIIYVPTVRLDTFCKDNEINSIDFLKIDTEGSELDVLEGASWHLKNNRIGMIQFEYGATYIDAHITLKQIYNLLTRYSFTLYRITPKYLLEITRWRNSLENFKYSNYLAVYNGL